MQSNDTPVSHASRKRRPKGTGGLCARADGRWEFRLWRDGETHTFYAHSRLCGEALSDYIRGDVIALSRCPECQTNKERLRRLRRRINILRDTPIITAEMPDAEAVALLQNENARLKRLLEIAETRVEELDARAKRKSARNNIHWSIRSAVRRRDQHMCRYCGRTCDDASYQLDHVIPALRGGEDIPDNLVVACRPCNMKKGSRTPEEAGMILRPPP